VTVSNNTVTLAYVPSRTILHAHLEFVVALQSMADSFVLRDPLSGGAGLTGGGAGLANANVLPLNLRWNTPRVDVQTGYSFYVPAGHFVPGAPDNTSTGFWTHSWQSGVTWYVTKNKTHKSVRTTSISGHRSTGNRNSRGAKQLSRLFALAESRADS
jgi:hypothetical protein